MLFLPGARFEYARSYYGRLKAWAEAATYLKRYSLYDIPEKSEKGEHMRLVHANTAMQ
jgi:hypothetical protein